tara:strand:- start:114 stop:404 length:291 start_codon:yes stop_codon:yes gene_type:complete
MDSNKKLFTRKEASLERKLSKFLVDLRWGALHKNTPNAKTKLISKKLRKTNPKVEDANECTDTTGPPLFMKVPNWARTKAMLSNTIFHSLNMFRRF